MKAFSYTRAASVSEAVGQLGVSGRTTRAMAGGVDLLDLLKEGLEALDVVVGLSGVPNLDKVETLSTGTVRIGARVTLAQLASDATLVGKFGSLSSAADNAATPQIRQMATLGGNLLQRPRCWYFRKEEVSCLKKGGSSCPGVAGDNRYLAIMGGGPCFAVQASSPSIALTALGAVLNVTGAAGSRQLSIDSLYVLPSTDPTRENSLGPTDVISSIDLPALPVGTTQAYKKVRHKESFDWAMAEAAVRLTVGGGLVTDVRIVLGGVAPIPWRSTAAENLLKGKAMSASLAAQAAAKAVEDASPLSGNAYKVPVARHVVEQALLEAAGLA